MHRRKKGKKANGVIRLEPEKRLLESARKIVGDLERFLEDADRSIPILLRALKIGDRHLKHQITSLLGGFTGHDIARPLYRIMKDDAEDPDLRHEAAIQLSVTFPFVNDPQRLIDCLLADVKSNDADLRSYAALALGWKGNHRALSALIERLDDPEEGVQQAAVNAMCNLQDDRVLHLLVGRLAQAQPEQKRTILFHLWRLPSAREEIAAVYRQYLASDDEELRYDAVVLLGRVTDTRDQMPFYRNCLQDPDRRVRELALVRLAQLEPDDLMALKPEIESMLSDPQMPVKQAAMRALKRIGS